MACTEQKKVSTKLTACLVYVKELTNLAQMRNIQLQIITIIIKI